MSLEVSYVFKKNYTPLNIFSFYIEEKANFLQLKLNWITVSGREWYFLRTSTHKNKSIT